MKEYESIKNERPPYQGWIYEDERNFTTVPIAGRAPSNLQGLSEPRTTASSGGYADPTVAFCNVDPFRSPMTSPAPSSTGQSPTKRERGRLPVILIFLAMIALLSGSLAATVIAAGNPIGQRLFHQVTPVAQRRTTAGQAGDQNTPGLTTQTQLPASWTASGLGQVEADEAELISQSFVERYQSIEGRNQQSLHQSETNAQLFLSRNALARFLGKVPGTPADPRATNSFAGVRQAAVINGPPTLLPPQMVGGNFFTLVTVPYRLTQVKNGQTQTTKEQMTVALAPVPYSGGGVTQSMGWVVVAWQQGSTPPALPLQP